MRAAIPLLLAVAACVAPLSVPRAAAQAQEEPVAAWEVGTRLGGTAFFRGGDSDTDLDVPGAGILGLPTLHAMYIHVSSPKPSGPPPSTFYIELEAGLSQQLEGAGGTRLVLGLQPGYLFAGQERSGYFGVNIALLSFDGDTELALGSALGYRIPVQRHFAVRLQAGYRRWVDSELNELTFAVILGAVLRG